MKRKIDWNESASNAESMSDWDLVNAYWDAVDSAHIWDKTPDNDPDGNGPYYHDLASVYHAASTRRGLTTRANGKILGHSK